jgi:hypothetical protein
MRKLQELAGGLALLLIGTALVVLFYDGADTVGHWLEVQLRHLLR